MKTLCNIFRTVFQIIFACLFTSTWNLYTTCENSLEIFFLLRTRRYASLPPRVYWCLLLVMNNMHNTRLSGRWILRKKLFFVWENKVVILFSWLWRTRFSGSKGSCVTALRGILWPLCLISTLSLTNISYPAFSSGALAFSASETCFTAPILTMPRRCFGFSWHAAVPAG